MVLEFDDKGKIFTNYITKDAVPSQIQTTTHRIRGYIHVRKDTRLSDEINQANLFIAITDAEICALDGEVLQKSDFLVVNRDQIVWIMPIEEN
jgi:hypothetical protein